MTFAPTELLTVYLDSGERMKVGRLARKQRNIFFEYAPEFVASGIELSPFKLPLKHGVFTPSEPLFEGLFGVFNDSLPDGWGRLLLDRAIAKHGIGTAQITVMDRLAHVGSGGMGALAYEPDRSDDGTTVGEERLALDRLAKEAATVLEGDSEAVFTELLRLNGSSAGARPKIVAQVNADKSRVIHGSQPLRKGYEHWMIKFASSQDPRDIGAIEYAYSLMARAAGVEMPKTHLFRTKKNAYFGAKRFDRNGDRRIHMHSLSGVIHADHRMPTLDYNLILRVVFALTKDFTEVEKAYTLACFNVLAYNRDDHPKNFSFLLDEDRNWKFSPAYDLTFSHGPGGEQATLVMGEGKSPGVTQLIALGKEHGLKRAADILAKVQRAVSKWKRYAEQAEVTSKSAKEISRKLAA
jgi:serine/threonine-protein kinase HipA